MNEIIVDPFIPLEIYAFLSNENELLFHVKPTKTFEIRTRRFYLRVKGQQSHSCECLLAPRQ